MNREWHRRAIFLDAALKKGVTSYREVADLIAAYNATPEETFEALVHGEVEGGPEP